MFVTLCRTPLMLSVLGGHTDCVVLLLERGACPDARDRKGRTALHRAVSTHTHNVNGSVIVGSSPLCSDHVTQPPQSLCVHV